MSRSGKPPDLKKYMRKKLQNQNYSQPELELSPSLPTQIEPELLIPKPLWAIPPLILP
ncbi:hypothetical protein MANES_08G026801v8 [Manihot esculenta]|uniref:Uncharacterized protein n=1 Tax=Manihot esculenta TaxID=3983 RepID=A0ACB7H8W9_MANES|nr:hypothetical protein MANES_08G026801v8 [Manihot esculenta]